MVAEVLEHLEPARGGVFVDCTVGLGGHARALLDAGASRLIGFDRDPAALAQAGDALSGYGDRGVSSMKRNAPGCGFSFRRDEALDMRMDTTAGPTAAEAIRDADERTLADVIYEFGEDRHARRIARAIVHQGGKTPIATTGQ